MTNVKHAMDIIYADLDAFGEIIRADDGHRGQRFDRAEIGLLETVADRMPIAFACAMRDDGMVAGLADLHGRFAATLVKYAGGVLMLHRPDGTAPEMARFDDVAAAARAYERSCCDAMLAGFEGERSGRDRTRLN